VCPIGKPLFDPPLQPVDKLKQVMHRLMLAERLCPASQQAAPNDSTVRRDEMSGLLRSLQKCNVIIVCFEGKQQPPKWADARARLAMARVCILGENVHMSNLA
jgi:hypothetical protein